MSIANNIDQMADLIGIIGVLLVLLGYFFMQTGYFAKKMFFYSLINLLGSIFLLFSLCYHWNLPSVIIELAWIAISIYGLVKSSAISSVHVKTDPDKFT